MACVALITRGCHLFFVKFIDYTGLVNSDLQPMEKDKKTGRDTIMGMDLGGSKLSGALFDLDGTMIVENETLLEGKGGSEVGALMVRQVQELAEYARINHYRIRSVGICVPGISNREKGTVWAPNIAGWEAYPLYSEIKEGLDNPRVPVSIESDRNCYILGELWKGNARGCSNAIFMAVGTGIGAGIVADGRIINGMNGIAGAIGWMALDRPYLSDYDHCGQFEFHASGNGIVKRANILLAQGTESNFLVRGKLSTRDVFSAYKSADPVAVHVIEESIAYWGMAVANLVSIFNPETIIFGGGVFGPAVEFLDRIFENAMKWAQPISIRQVKLKASSLKGRAGLLGAGYTALVTIS